MRRASGVSDAGTVTRIRRLTQGNETRPVTARPARAQPSRLAGACQVLTIAVLLLALLVIGSAVFSRGHGMPGPPALMIGCHVAGAIVVLLLQRAVSRTRPPAPGLAVLGIGAVLVALLWFFWWH